MSLGGGSRQSHNATRSQNVILTRACLRPLFYNLRWEWSWPLVVVLESSYVVRERSRAGHLRLIMSPSKTSVQALIFLSLPPLNPRQKPRHVIDYAKTTRQNVLKYLAILRWKAAVDTPASAAGPSGATQVSTSHVGANGASFPTPQTNGESNDTSPAAYAIAGKGKAKALDSEDSKPAVRGKVTDTKRIQQFMEHQNRQHEEAIMHVKHTAKVVEGLR